MRHVFNMDFNWICFDYIGFYGHLVMWQGLLGITKTKDFK